MKEDWLNDIHDKLANYEADEAPRGLWQDICRERAAQQTAQRKKAKQRIVWLWTKRVSAVAAVLIIVLTLGHWLYRYEPNGKVSNLVAHVDTINKEYKEQHEEQGGEGQQIDVPIAALTSREVKASSQREKIADKVAPIAQEVENPTLEANPSAVASIPKEQPSQRKQQKEQPSPKKQSLQLSQNNETTHADYSLTSAVSHMSSARFASRISLSAYTTGSLTDTHSTHSKGEYWVAGAGPDYAGWQDDPVLGMLLYNQGKDITTQMKHHLPVKVGLSLAYAINKRLSLEAGIMYTRLTSDLREGSDSHYFMGQQTLHYVGIPLGVKCQVLKAKRLEVYALSGVEVAKCVSGETRKDYVLNNETKKTETNSTSEHPFQWSVKAAAGVQYNVLPQLGIYAEPGVSYYIKDGSSLRTIYKDKPFNFDLHVGLRVNLGH